MQQWQISVVTGAGQMPVHVACDDQDSALPLVIVYMDALGWRDELRQIAVRIAAQGYFVALPNLYYRVGGPSFDPTLLPDYVDPEMERLNVETTTAMVAADTAALLAELANEKRVDVTRVGAIGFCMGGRHAITAAAEFSDSVRAAASIHGGRLVNERDDSAHRRIAEVRGELYFGFADDDPAAPLEHLEAIRGELHKHGIRGRAELHPGALHGFAFPERYCYHQQAAESSWRAWFSMLDRVMAQPHV